MCFLQWFDTVGLAPGRTFGLKIRMHTLTHTHTHTQPFYSLFRDHPGEPVPEENFWSLWCKGRLTEADTPTIRLGATPSGLPAPTSTRPTSFSQIFPTIDSLPASGLTPRTSRPDRFFWASPFYVCFSFFIILFCLVPCGRLSWLLVSFWSHVNIVNRIISYRIPPRAIFFTGRMPFLPPSQQHRSTEGN